MKKNYYFLTILAIPVILVLMAYSSGSPGGKTGSLMDENTCTSCHDDFPLNSADGWITSNIPATGYSPGQTYTITLTGTHIGVEKFGFEVTSESSDPQKVGTWIITDVTQTQLTNSNKAVTHTSSGNTPSGNSKTWTVDWIAPTSGTGEVLFSAAFNAANGNGNTSGDVIYKSHMGVSQSTVGLNNITETVIKMYPNPATDYIIIENAKDAEMKLYDMIGRLITSNTISEIDENINISNFDAGVYFVVVSKEGENFSKKLIVR